MTRCTLIVACSLVLSVAAQAQVDSGPRYLALTRGSTFGFERCLPPCACPFAGETLAMRGGLVLVPEVAQPPVYYRYRVAQVNWTTQPSTFPPNQPRVLVGEGVYEEFGDFVLQRRLRLRLAEADNAPLDYDSGMVIGGGLLSAATGIMGCQQRTVSVDWLSRCPADYYADGVIDPDDLADFIAGYFAAPADPRSDFNLDGITDPDDLSDFITAFFGECRG